MTVEYVHLSTKRSRVVRPVCFIRADYQVAVAIAVDIAGCDTDPGPVADCLSVEPDYIRIAQQVDLKRICVRSYVRSEKQAENR
jgi:hypothetical protein